MHKYAILGIKYVDYALHFVHFMHILKQGSIILDPCVILIIMLQNVGHNLHNVA